MPATRDLPTWLLGNAALRAHRILSDRLADAGARGYEYRILEALSDATPLSQVDIGSRARLDKRDVAVTLTVLDDSGYVVRRPDPADARRNVVELTDAGRARHEELASIVEDVQEHVLAPLDPVDRESFIAALRLLQPLT
ncbi:DNA-binding MarR family transcriptional regulator [Microbacterium ginsengiterrae]|uniref:DNA-binding MarR family transcriptional regulator n=1 Tax=Microbacterium ginsengiterrae TaxID=546115 RepID=A0A7W9CEP9_9MICO|nr:MarR family winged helix-turn-helix transcriptional regulator [Microbacterium ginsengiterrae]MBB5744093.1 DNA-binding MarR family transcriptional regulator [Microbacterium ginsengiterrae]